MANLAKCPDCVLGSGIAKDETGFSIKGVCETCGGVGFYDSEKIKEEPEDIDQNMIDEILLTQRKK